MDLTFLDGADAVTSAAAVPIIVALVQLFKMIGNTKTINKFAPFIALAMGILIAFLMNADDMRLHETILAGILYGLSASGLYSSTKHTAHQIQKDTTGGI
jgi:hypothetical protein